MLHALETHLIRVKRSKTVCRALHSLLPLSPPAVSNATAERSMYVTPLQPGEHYALWMTASTAAGEGPWGNRELVCLESNDPLGVRGQERSQPLAPRFP